MKTKQILELMKVGSWIIFIGFCIKAGAILFSTIVSLYLNPESAENLYLGLDLSKLYLYSQQYYIYLISFIVAIAILQAYLFWLLIRTLSKIYFKHPFTVEVAKMISQIAYYTLLTGIIAVIADSYESWLSKKGIPTYHDWGASELLFMAGILFVIAFIFKRGVELQQENDLTI
jgi:predicted PurR-regulated permease PerM